MSIDLAVLKRLLNLTVNIEGNNSWAFRELLDVLIDILDERLPLIVNEVLEPYGLEASILEGRGCDEFPELERCEEILVVEVYEKDAQKPLVKAGYRFSRGSNTLEIKLVAIKGAEITEEL